MSIPQLYSQDYYLRLSPRGLAGVRLQHLATMQDPTVLQEVRRLRVPGRRAGIAEWEGVEQGRVLSLGWDWVELEDGAIHPLTVVAPRTNIMPIDRKGYDMTGEWSAPCLWELIASLAWQPFAAA